MQEHTQQHYDGFMDTTSDLGIRIRQLRKSRGESLVDVARAIETDRAYLNKIELGTIRPSERLLDRIIVYFSVEHNSATILKQLAGHIPLKVAVVDTSKENQPMADIRSPMPAPTPQVMPQVTVNPAQTPVMYTDSVFVSSSEYGLVLDVAQTFAGGMQQAVVARIGMSFEHARKLIATIQDQMEKNER